MHYLGSALGRCNSTLSYDISCIFYFCFILNSTALCICYLFFSYNQNKLLSSKLNVPSCQSVFNKTLRNNVMNIKFILVCFRECRRYFKILTNYGVFAKIIKRLKNFAFCNRRNVKLCFRHQ